MIRSVDRKTSRGISSPRTGTARGSGAECRDHILGTLQLEGELFSLDIPSHRTGGWPDFFGSPKISEISPLVNMADSQRINRINNDTGQLCKLSGAKTASRTLIANDLCS